MNIVDNNIVFHCLVYTHKYLERNDGIEHLLLQIQIKQDNVNYTLENHTHRIEVDKYMVDIPHFVVMKRENNVNQNDIESIQFLMKEILQKYSVVYLQSQYKYFFFL